MREVDIRRLDLNLLFALDALLEEKSVTKAAVAIGISQPAASRALGRLRAMFADPLLVDGPGGYVLSVRAEELRPTLRTILLSVERMLAANSFNPATAQGRVRLLMQDLEAATIGPHLLAHLAQQSPHLDLEIIAPGGSGMDALEHGRADAMVALIDNAPAGIRRRALYNERLVTLMRVGHPALAEELTLERFLALEHIVVSVTGVGPAPVDEALGRMGRARRVKLRVPNFFAAVEIAARSDLVMTLPVSLARAAANMGRFVSSPPPLKLGSFTMSLAWHARHQDAPMHVWLRSVIVAAASASSSDSELG